MIARRSLLAALALSFAVAFPARFLAAQQVTSFIDGIEGSYEGTVRRAVSASMASQATIVAGRSQQEPPETLQDTMRRAEAASRSHETVQPVPVNLTLTRASDGWRIEIRHPEDRFGLPLPSFFAVSLRATPAALAPSQTGGTVPASWKALATQTAQSLTVHLFDVGATATPTQFQISLQPVGKDLELAMWRIDSDGHRAMSWTGLLARQGK
jgi:hypothetical protein